jgi:hypothetical protein
LRRLKDTMKKIASLVTTVICLAGIILKCSSCGKEDSKPPTISFAIDSVLYISRDTALLRESVFNVGIVAAKTGLEGMLSGMTVSFSRSGSGDSIIQQMSFVKQAFFQFYSYQAPDSGVSDRYTFTVFERDGLSNSVSLTVTGL